MPQKTKTLQPLQLQGFFGGAKGIRTPDLLTASQTRSQLRYSPKTQPSHDSITADMISIPKIYFLTAYVRKG
jgi:hypothetical protein